MAPPYRVPGWWPGAPKRSIPGIYRLGWGNWGVEISLSLEGHYSEREASDTGNTSPALAGARRP
jgi:hypothetical protein